MLINQSWLLVDEIYQNIEVSGDTLDAYLAQVDRYIIGRCIVLGVSANDIPVDGDEYVTSVHLQELAIAYALFLVFRGYWGSGEGTNDIYFQKKSDYEKSYLSLSSSLTKPMIEVGDGSTGLTPDQIIRSHPVVLY